MQETLVLGLAGWSGAGKTTLLKALLPVLVRRGLRVSTLKHAHHEFDVDVPGKDSWEHRRAGAGEVIVSSARRWVQMHELDGEPEATLPQLLRRFSRCDLILVEGFKHSTHPRMEVYRPAVGKPPLYVSDPAILAVATDGVLPFPHPRCVALSDVQAVADCVLDCACPLDQTLARLESG
jgi:molybdopterin-guanine dinucleotide biosynthesis adapter protein